MRRFPAHQLPNPKARRFQKRLFPAIQALHGRNVLSCPAPIQLSSRKGRAKTSNVHFKKPEKEKGGRSCLPPWVGGDVIALSVHGLFLSLLLGDIANDRDLKLFVVVSLVHGEENEAEHP